MEIHSRSVGLDVLRSTAILLVLFVHSASLTDTPGSFLPLPDGVDLFFVLSGFLVGRLFIQHLEKNETHNLAGVLVFLRRRWFRTLPNYFLFLLLNILLVYAGIANGRLNKCTFTYFVFFQNFYKPFDFFFWESWSLSVEEWFYLLFPLSCLMLFRVFRSKVDLKKVLGAVILLFLLVPLFIRFYMAQTTPDFDLYIRKLVITRLDTIGYGLAGAYIWHYHKTLWQTRSTLLFAAGSVGAIAIQFVNPATSYLITCVYHSLTGFCILLLLPLLTQLSARPTIARPFEFVSRISYSLYLVHTPVLVLLKYQFRMPEGYHPVAVPLFWLLSFVLATAIYRYYEKPTTDLRDKISA